MRRALVAGAAGLTLFLAAACGGDDGGDGGGDGNGGPSTPPVAESPTPAGGTASTEEVCAEGEQLLTAVGTEGDPVRDALDALIDAAASGDAAAIEDARSEYLAATGEFVQEVRDLGVSAADPELAAAVERFADEFEAAADAAAADPEEIGNQEITALQTATLELGALCGFE